MPPIGADSRPPSPTADWLPDGAPRRLGNYRIVRLLGRGGMGVVYEGLHTLLGQRVAVKVLPPHFARDPHFVGRFRREMAALGQISAHPNLVRAQYAGEEEGLLYLAMDFVDGEDLGQLLRRRGPLAPTAACEVVRQAALGLEAVRQAGLVHRDIKPSNLMLSLDGTVKILDLGLARLCEPGQAYEELTPTNVQLGTFDYQAPEQSDDPRGVDIRADIYSLGCTLYHLLTGRPPFAQHSSPAKKIDAHARLPFPTAGPETPDGIDAVLARMTAKEPGRRYTTPRELADALTPFAAGARPADLCVEAPPAAEMPAHAAPTVDRENAPAPITAASALAPAGPARRVVHGWVLLASAGVVGLALAALILHRVLGPATPPAVPPPSPETRRDGDKPPPSTDPILAAGNEPRPLDGMAPFEQHELLDQAPVQAYWDPADGTAYRAYDLARKQLLVQSPGESLFQLGALTRPSFTLTLQIKQPHWGKGVGAYMGYHESEEPGTSALTFQYLAFSERETLAGLPVCTVARGRCRLRNVNGRKLFEWGDLASEDIETPLQEAWLILEVTDRRLFRVRVNGVELKKLTAPAMNKVFTEVDYRGEIGLLCSANSTVFHHAALTILSPP